MLLKLNDDTKNHTHTGYASSNHSHNNYIGNIYVGTDGKLHKTTVGGADTVLPFSNKIEYEKLNVLSGNWVKQVSPYPYGVSEILFTAPAKGLFVINTKLDIGVGKEYISNGTITRYIAVGSSVKLNDFVAVNNMCLPFITPGTKYSINKNEAIVIRAIFSGSCKDAVDEIIDGSGGALIEMQTDVLFTFIYE